MDVAKFIDPYKVPETQRYWVVRAEGGAYFQHFRLSDSIAIGHLDFLGLPETFEQPYQPDFQQLYKMAADRMHEQEHLKGQITSLINQTRSFLEDMSVGDLIVTPTGNRVSIGRVVGKPRISRNPVFAAPYEGADVTEMRFTLRRKIAWGPIVYRSNFTQDMTRSLRANQTIFNIDNHWQAVNHLLHPVFEKDGNIYYSFKINQE